MSDKLKNYGVVLTPGLFPGNTAPFKSLRECVFSSVSKVVDAGYNNKEFYVDGKFDLESYKQSVLDAILEIKDRCEKIILVGISAGCMPQKEETYSLLDGQILLSPTYYADGIGEWEKFFEMIIKLAEKGRYNKIEKFYKKSGLESMGVSLDDLLSDENMFMQICRKNYLFDHGNLLDGKEKLDFSIPTLAYFSEKELQFINSEVSFSEMTGPEKLFYLTTYFSKHKKQRRRHLGLHRSKNPNYKLAQEATGNYQILTNMSHPDLYLGHGEFRKHINPYIYLVDYLVEIIEKDINLRNEDKFDARKVLIPHTGGVIRGIIRNFINEMSGKQTEDREITYMVESLLRLDNIDEITLLETFISIIEKGTSSLYHGIKGWNNPHWHPVDLRETLT